MTVETRLDHEPWPARAALLGGVGALFGFLFHSLATGTAGSDWTDAPHKMSAAAFLAVGGMVFAFSLERQRWTWSAAFAGTAALVAAFVTWWNGTPGNWGAGEGWQLTASLIAIALAVPLFQAARDAGAAQFEPAAVHGHAWTNLILWAAAWAFVGATLLLTLLLAMLFELIGIRLLRNAMEEGWFIAALACGALGLAVGLLRDRDRVVGTLQKVVRAILSVLAPVLALGLVLFVLALPATGLEPLWSATKATTPILLLCILGSVLLVNAVAGNEEEEEAAAPVLRYSAMALAATMTPLALVAAISTGKRIGQYGFTPDRLWAAVFVAVAGAFAIGYLIALVRGRLAWPAQLRLANVRLAAGVSLLALFLALPIVSFGAISARDQLARLESGRTPADRFDWRAMRYDFGPSGRRALERLAASANAVVRQRAREALDSRSPWDLAGGGRDYDGTSSPPPAPKLRVDGNRPVPQPLLDLVARSNQCYDNGCRLVFVTPSRAVLLSADGWTSWARLFEARSDGTWVQRNGDLPTEATVVNGDNVPRATGRERVEIRPVERSQVFIDGRPVGPVFAP